MNFSRIAGCPFCDEFFDGGDNSESALLNDIGIKSRVIYRDNDFVVFPTIGGFIPGYILLATIKHYPCFGALNDYELSKAQELITKFKSVIRDIYGTDCVIFEHGMLSCGYKYGGCIDHAHIHFIPLSEPIISSIESYGMNIKKIDSLDQIRKCYKDGSPYLFLSDVDGTYYEIHNIVIPSQFLRQVICKKIGMEQYWNWHVYDFKENLALTLEQFQDFMQ